MPVSQQKARLFAVPGLGPRRENQSWYTLRDRDLWQKAGVNGKRLKDVLDKSLEQDPKRALQEIERLIKKHGSSAPFLACKAIAIHRLDPLAVKTTRTSLDILDSIVVDPELDDFTIHCIIHFHQHESADYSRLHNFLQRVVTAKETKGAANLALLEMICTIYMRHQNAKESQKVALILARHEPVLAAADRHCLLAVVSLIAQAMECPDSSKKRSMLSLALRTLQKRFSRPQQESAFKLWTLLQMEDVPAFTQLFDQLFQPNNLQDDANMMVEFIIWYCGLLLSLGTGNAKEDLSKVDSLLDVIPPHLRSPECLSLAVRRHAHIFIATLTNPNLAEERETIMESFIAGAIKQLDILTFFHTIGVRLITHLELLRCLTEESSKLESQDIKEWIEQIMQKGIVDRLVDLFQILGSKPSFYSDIHRYLILLSPKSARYFLDRIGLESSVEALSLLEDHQLNLSTADQVLRHQNYLITGFSLRHLAPQSTNPQTPDLTRKLVRRLFSLRRTVNAQFSQSDGQSGEMVALGDMYGTLALRHLLDVFRSSKDWSTFLECVVLLESMLRKPKHLCNPSFRLLLIQLYVFCGAFPAAYEHFRNLDVKSLQLNHLSHMLLSAGCVSNMASWGMELVESVVRFFTGTMFECFEGQLQLISRNEFLRVLDLEDVRRSLKYSSTFLAAVYLRPWMMVSQQFVVDGEVKNWWNDLERFLGPSVLTLWQSVDDKEIVPAYDVQAERNQITEHLKRQEEEKMWLSIMRRQMELYSCCITLSSTYVRYDPFSSSKSMKEQLSDEIPLDHIEVAMDARERTKRAAEAFFSDCQRASQTIQSTSQLETFESNFSDGLRIFVKLGCHALLLRLGQLVTALDAVVADTLSLHGGSPAFTDAKQSSEDKQQDGEKIDNTASNKLDAKLFGEVLASGEISLKVEQMISFAWVEWENAEPTDLSRWKSFLSSLSLLLQSVRCVVWNIPCLSRSLISLHAYNEALGKSQKSDFKKVLDDWCGELTAFIESLVHPLDTLVERLNKLLECYGSDVMKCFGLDENQLGRRFTDQGDFPLENGDSQEDKLLSEMIGVVSENVGENWVKWMKELIAITEDSSKLLHSCADELRNCGKSKSGRPSVPQSTSAAPEINQRRKGKS